MNSDAAVTNARRAGWLPALLLLLAPALPADAEFGDPIQGQSLFVAKGCVRCHAVRGAGGSIGPDLGRTPAKASFYEIAARMWNHTGMMDEKMREFRIPRATFEGDELSDLIAFLYFLNYFDEPGDPQAGKVLFSDKHCIQCHSLGGEGGSDGPALDDLPRGLSPLLIAQKLWNHGPAMMRAIRRRGLEVPVFNDGEIVDLFAFLRSQGQRGVTHQFQSAGDPERGEQIFAAKGCAHCHEVVGSEGAIGPDLGTHELRGSVTQLAGRMWNHWPAMAEAMEALDMPLPEFAGDELAEIFAFLLIRRYEGEAGRVGRGREIYETQGCAYCHGLQGEGRAEALGPPLRDVTTNRAKEDIVQKLWNHAPGMWERMESSRLSWPRFTAQELTDLLAFLAHGWSEPSGAGEPRASE